MNNKKELLPAKEIYSDNATKLYIVNAKDNKLKRPLIAFYRHPKYNLSKTPTYRKNMNTYFNSIIK